MSSERQSCAHCGANNFATQQNCWSCHAPLLASRPVLGSVPVVDDPMVIPAIAVIVLSILTPFISLCAGLVFLMLSGKRNTTLGWWNIIAGVIGTVLHVVALAFILPSVTSGLLTKTLSGLSQQRQQNDVNQSQSILNGQGQ